MCEINKHPPEYSEKMLLNLINETNSIDDLVKLCDLLNALERQKDLVITEKMYRAVKQQQRIIIKGWE